VRQTLRSHLRFAFAAFLLAAAAGVFFRFGAAGLLSLGPLGLGDIRHAHSHLMLFSWVTPVIAALIGLRLAADPGTLWWRLVRLALGLGMLSFPCFLLWGYEPATIGPARIPLAVIVSTLSMFVWYALAWQYRHRRPDAPPTEAIRLWDLAFILLVVSTIGGWGRGAVAGMGIEDPFWQSATVHSFVDLFAEGWLGVATLGLLYDRLDLSSDPLARRATRLMAVGLPFVFLLGIRVDLVPPTLRLLGSLSGLLVAAGYLLHVTRLWQATRRPTLRLALAALAIKASALALATIPPVARWAETNHLQIPYLHVFLLGFVSLVLLELALQRALPDDRHPGVWPMYAAVALLLLTLWPATGLWPSGWLPDWRLTITAAGSLGPPIVGLAYLPALLD
jgi:hypothetical protein